MINVAEIMYKKCAIWRYKVKAVFADFFFGQFVKKYLIDFSANRTENL